MPRTLCLHSDAARAAADALLSELTARYALRLWPRPAALGQGLCSLCTCDQYPINAKVLLLKSRICPLQLTIFALVPLVNLLKSNSSHCKTVSYVMNASGKGNLLKVITHNPSEIHSCCY